MGGGCGGYPIDRLPAAEGGIAGGSGGCTGGRRWPAPARRTRGVGVCRVLARCLAGVGSIQAPGIGDDAPAAAWLTSHDRGACPA
jgi:hypothetical protein